MISSILGAMENRATLTPDSQNLPSLLRDLSFSLCPPHSEYLLLQFFKKKKKLFYIYEVQPSPQSSLEHFHRSEEKPRAPYVASILEACWGFLVSLCLPLSSPVSLGSNFSSLSYLWTICFPASTPLLLLPHLCLCLLS